MTGPRRRSRLVALALVVLAGGCATLPPVPRQRIGPDARQALDRLAERAREVSGLRTLAAIRVQRGGERQQLTAVLLAKPPDSVRFEALAPTGQPLFVATIRDGRLVAYDATTDEATVGPATAETAAKMMNLPFAPRDLVAVLAGHAVPPEDIRVAEVVPGNGLGPSIELTGEVNRRRIWMDLDTGLVRQLELSGGRAEARIVYERDSGGELRGFDLTAMLGYITASVRYQNPVFRAELPDELFALAIPKTAKINDIR